MSSTFSFVSVLLVLVLALFAHGSLADQDRCRFNITYGAFVAETQYVVAQNLGYFADEDVCVTFNQVSSSTQQFDSLASGQYQVINTAFDNVVNRFVNQGKDLSVIGSDNKGPDLAVVVNTQTGVSTLSDLLHKNIAVDAPNSGLVYTMRAVLASAGLFLENGDYNFIQIGGFPRFIALRNGWYYNSTTGENTTIHATISAYPLSLTLPSWVIIPPGGRVKDVVYPVQLEILAVNSTWARVPQNRLALVRFLRAYIKASLYILNSANRDAVIEMIRVNITSDHTTATAEKAYNVVVSDVGISYAARLTRQGLVNIMNVRQRFEPFVPFDGSYFNSTYIYNVLTPTSGGLIDLSFYREAFLTVDTDQLYEQLFDT
jgi:hypothetical protein